MRHTPARAPDRDGRRDPASPGSDLLATIVRGTLAVALGCGGTMVLLLILAVLLSLFLG